MKNKILLIILIYIPTMCFSQSDGLKFSFNGFADTYHAVRSKSPNDFMSSRSRLRTELSVTKGKSYLFASLNSSYNSLLPDQTGIELREAYFQYTSNNWDLKLGRQIVIWGVADGMRVTDIVSPMDFTEFLARDYDDIRIPVNAIKLKYIKSNYNLEMVFVPISEFFIIPADSKNPWSFTYNSPIPMRLSLDDKPQKTLRNCEFGARLSFFLSGIDFSMSALNTWNKMPAFMSTQIENSDSVIMDGHYGRMQMLGFDFSAPLGQFVFRGEIATYLNELQENGSIPPVKKNSMNYLLGADWYPGSEWTVTGQFYLKHINNTDNQFEGEESTQLGTLGITKKLFRSTLSLSTFSYIDLKNNGFFNRTSADYSLTDQIHLMAGYDWFKGDEGMFCFYKNNSEYWLKAKFSF